MFSQAFFIKYEYETEFEIELNLSVFHCIFYFYGKNQRTGKH